MSEEFGEFFLRATGNTPYRYQRELAEGNPSPDVLTVPTGSGKTQAVLAAWLHERSKGTGPRRLVYALPMRSLVEQTAEVAVTLRDRLGLETELPINVLMGGVEPTDWRECPECDQVLIGTIDMLLSRALNRGYAESRFAWPVAFGLLHNDCRWVFDEVQLMGPARATSTQLDGLRRKLGTLLPCQTLWMSATLDPAELLTIDRPDLGRTLDLPDEDRHGSLAARLEARKVLERVDVSAETPKQVPGLIAEAITARHVEGSRSIVVLNTVGRAQATARELERQLRGADPPPAVVLIHSRFRPPDRRERMEEALAPGDPGGSGTIVVATQVIEAGVDLSSRLLATETAPFSSIVQRLGRCNRAGEFRQADVVWFDAGPVESGARGAKAAAPYQPEDLAASRDALMELVGSSLSPAALSALSVFELADEPAALRRRDLLDLFDTSPDLSGLDVDVAPFIRADDDRNVNVFFRQIADGRSPATLASSEQPAPERDELVQVPLSQLGERNAWLFDHVDELWRLTRTRAIPPGATVMLDSKGGGYSPSAGWDPAATGAVDPNGPVDEPEPPDAMGADHQSVGSGPQELGDHLTGARDAAKSLARALELPGAAASAVIEAAALHDVGKAHPVFQETLRSVMENHEAASELLWAKSGRRGGRHRRRHFRHELVSALALQGLGGELELADDDLVLYLIAAHHGKVRLSIRPAADERPPEGDGEGARFALGVVEGDVLPALQTPLGPLPETTLDLSCMELGSELSWTRRAAALRDDLSLGPFRLGLLEALVRVSDWRASG